jgi:hypothetical protein
VLIGQQAALAVVPDIWPDGQITSPSNCGVSSPFRKNISVFQKYESSYMSGHPVPLRGALRNVTSAGRVAVAADGAPDEGT